MNCNVKIRSNAVINEVISFMINDISDYEKIATINSDNGIEIPTDDYVAWFKQKYPNDTINFYPKTNEDKEFQKNKIIEYLQYLHPTITFNSDNILTTFHSQADLSEIKRFCIASCLFNFLHKHNGIPQSLDTYRTELINLTKYYINLLKDELGISIDLTKSYSEILESINNEDIKAEDLRLLKNNLALYFELSKIQDKNKNQTYNKFIFDLSKNDLFKGIIANKENEILDLDNDESDYEGEVRDNTQTDTSIADFDHSGLKRNALEHLSLNTKAILSTIPILNSTELIPVDDSGTLDYDYTYSDSLFAPMYMDYKKVFNKLFSKSSYASMDNFLETLNEIAKNEKEFAGLKWLYDQCKNDKSNTLIGSLWQIFGKPIIDKVTIVQNENEIKIQVSKNNKIENILKNNFSNFIRNNRNNVGNIIGDIKHVNDIKIDIIKDSIKNNLEKRNKIINEYITKPLRRIFGETYITDQVIYMVINENSDNITNLINIIKSTYTEYNKLTDKDSINNTNIDKLINILKPYLNVSIEYTSLNAEGNPTSDIINANFLTRIRDIFNNKELLKDFCNKRLKAELQHKYSNILIGDNKYSQTFLYKNSDGEYELTDNAPKLLEVALFNGISNYDFDKSNTYHKSSKSDYICSIINVFKSDEPKYFLRIPSDAKNNYCIKFTKTSVDTLFKINSDNNKHINPLDLKNKPIYKSQVPSKFIDDDTFINKIVESTLKPNEEISLNVPNHKDIKDGEKIIIAYKVRRNNPEQNNSQIDEFGYQFAQTQNIQQPTIYVEGVITNGVLTGKIIGKENIINDGIDKIIRRRYRRQLDLKGSVNRTINTKHDLFKQLTKQFKQELLDIADAINFLFQTNSDGLIACSKENSEDVYYKVKLKDGSLVDIIDFNPKDIDGCCANYHYKVIKLKNGKSEERLVDTDNDGNVKFIGNAFKSNKFVVTTIDENGKEITRNLGQEFIDKHFNLLYGGADNNWLKVIKNEQGALTDINVSGLEADIDAFISEYVMLLVKDTLTRLNEFKDIIGDDNVTFDQAAELALNYQIFYGICDELFEGDTKYYKSIADLLKRAKEIQGSGIPYGGIDLKNAFNQTIIEDNADKIKEDSAKDYETITIDANEPLTIKDYKYFTGVTIYNTKTTSENTINVLRSKLKSILNPSNSKQIDDQTDNQINDLLSAYEEITINDAQSYITLEEWIRRLHKRGLLLKHYAIIEKILNDEPLNAKDLNSFAQVQKNFYYDQYYDKATGRFRPRQIKNAEFVLIPQLIKGTELEVVYNLMKKHNIDQLNTVETSKASKTNILKVFNEKTGVLDQDIIEEINKPNNGIESDFTKQLKEKPHSKELFQYEFLYTQQDTPQHMDARNKASIQIMKKIIDNINEYSSKDLQQLKEDYLKTYSLNIKESAFELFKELKVLTKDGKLDIEIDGNDLILKGLDYNKINSYLENEQRRRSLNKNVLDYIKYDPETHTTVMPNYMTILGDRVENMVQAIFNSNITRQTLPGFHAAQISSVGLKTLASNKGQVGYSDKLQYHVDENNKYVSYVEVLLPKSAFKFGNKDLEYLEGETEEQYNDRLLKLLEDKGLDKFIGYRIPTEGKQSICVMKVKGFISDAHGSTIVVPNEWVGQTGSDFDIDSVYGITKPTYIENGTIQAYKYNPDDDISTLDKQERETRIVTNMLNILKHDESLIECLSSSNFKKITTARDIIYKECNLTSHARRQNRSGYNILDQADSFEDAMGGATLKGFSVSRDNLCSVCNTVKPLLTKPITIAYRIIKNDETANANEIHENEIESIKNRFNRDGVNNVKIENNVLLITHDMFGWSNDNKNIHNDILTIYSSQTTAHILDAIKEGFISNVNTYTFGIYKLFPDIGSDYFTSIAFMAQPGVSDIIKQHNKINSTFTDKHGNPVYAAIRALANEIDPTIGEYANLNDCRELIKSYTGYTGFDKSDNHILSYDQLVDNLKYYEDHKNYDFTLSDNIGIHKRIIHDKIKAIDQFIYLQNIANKIGRINSLTNPDKFGAKQTIDATNKTIEDIIREIKSNEPILVSKDNANINFLSEIYPRLGTNSELDIDESIIDYINNSNDEESKHQILHSFLKYSTATSIIINRQLFPTQTYAFRHFIKQINDYLSDGKRLNEQELKEFKQYFIAYIYTQCNIISNPYTYDLNKTSKSLQPLVKEPTLNTKTDELKRISGYVSSNDLENLFNKIKINSGESIDEKQEKLNKFALLTPAEKVEFLKRHTDTSNNVFYYITSILNPIFGPKAQRLTFGDNILNEDDILNEIENIFNKENDSDYVPYYKLAIVDLIKYAFVVERYKMVRRGISKIIPNSILYNELNNKGIGLIPDLNSKFKNIDSLFDDSVIIDYVRSHHKKLGFKTKRVDNNELTKSNSGLIYVPLHSTNENLYANQLELLSKYNIINSDKHFNKFVKLKYGSNTATLYRIKQVPTKDCIILYPLNELEENENGEFSNNDKNNKYPSHYYYEEVIEKYAVYEKTDIKLDNNTIKEKLGLDVNEFKRIGLNTLLQTKYEKRLKDNLNDPKYNKDLADEIKHRLFEFYNVVENYDKYYFLQLRDMYKIVGNDYENLVILSDKNNDKTIVLPLKITQISPSIALQIQSRFLSKNDKGEYPNIPNKFKHYTNLINNLRNQGIVQLVEPYVYNGKTLYKYINTPIYIVNTPKNNVKKSEISETNFENISVHNVLDDLFNTIKLDLRQRLTDYASEFENKIKTDKRDIYNINSKNLTNVETKTILKYAADYIENRVNNIISQCKKFYTDDNELIFSIEDNKVIELISNDRTGELASKFYELIFTPNDIIKNNQSILNIPVNEQDNEIKEHLNRIRKTIDKLKTNDTINNAKNKLAQSFSKDSTNPLTKEGILDIINSFSSASWFETHIGNIHDTPDTFIQVVTKYIDDYIFTKQKEAEEKARKVKDEMNDIIKNSTINWSHIIDDNGIFIQEFIPNIKDVYNELISQRTKYINDYSEYIENPDYDKKVAFNKFKKYVDSIYNLDRFKYNYLQQELVDNYYKEKLELDTYMIKHHNKMFVTYKSLMFKLNKLYDQKNLVENNPNIDDQIREIRAIIKELRYKGTEYDLKPIYDLEKENTIDKWDVLDEDLKFKSYESADALDNYIKRIDDLNNKYKEKKVNDEFTQKLEYYLNIISKYNKLKAKGSPINETLETEFELANTWISKNADQTLSGNIKTEVDEAFTIITKNSKTGNSEFESIIERNRAKDIYGVIDGRRLSADLQAKVKRIEEASNIKNKQGLIKTGVNDDSNIYTSAFYNRMKVRGVDNESYLNAVQEINEIVKPYYNPITKVIEFDKIPDTEEGIKTLQQLIQLYNVLKNTKKKIGANKNDVTKVIEFMNENVDINIPTSAITVYTEMREKINDRSNTYISLFERLNTMQTSDKNNFKLNFLIYGVVKPKAEVLDDFLDKDKSKAFETLNKVYELKETEYYKQELLRRQSVSDTELIYGETYDEWFNRNHIYDDRTGTFKPTKIWTTYEVKAEYKSSVTWEPKWFNAKNQVKEEYANPFYKKDGGLDLNYRDKDHKLTHNTNEGKTFRFDKDIIDDQFKYDNPIFYNQTEDERKMRIYLQNLMYELVKSKEAINLLDKGYAPMMIKSQTDTIKDVIKELGKTLGLITANSGKEYWHEDIDFSTKFPSVPFLQLLNQSKINLEKPVRDENESLEEYNKRYEQYEKDLKEANKANEEAHKSLLNNDWINVFPEFVKAVINHNALQDVKGVYLLGKEVLKSQEYIIQKYGSYGDLKIDKSKSTDDKTVYKKKHNDNLLKQYMVYGNRLFFNEYKEPNGMFTRIGSILQSMTSAKYMMLNIKGGIANMTLGGTQILAEQFASQYFNFKDYAKANANWISAIIPMFANMNKAESSNVHEAIIKFFNVVDLDEHLGRAILAQSPNKKAFIAINKVLYAPQTIGESALQQTVLLAMLESHRVFETKDGVKIMNLQDYLINNDIEALKKYLANKPELLNEYTKFIEDIKTDENKLKQYAWYYNDVVSDFAKQFLSKDQIYEFSKLKEERKGKLKEDFYKAPTVESQLALGDKGYMTFAKDSILEKYNNENNDSLKAISRLRNRVVSVNQKMHGYYNKLAQAQIEKKWWGGLVMQYHKHIYPGILKRFRVKGMYSEQRGTIEKGSYVSAVQFFLGLPFKEIKKLNDLTDAQKFSILSIQNIFKGIYNFIVDFKVHWHLLPTYEKQNMMRMAGDVAGILVGFLAVMLLKGIDDDEKEDKIWYNLALYEADRLANESAQFNPMYAFSNLKKLWATPIAAQSSIEDLFATMNLISCYLFDDNFESTYQTGKFAGENKFKVKLVNNIPIYRQWLSITDLKNNNKYYKIGENTLNNPIFNNILEWSEDEDDE